MKKILEYIAFISAAVYAISEGAKVCASHWPVNNPFAKKSELEEIKRDN